MQFEDDEILQGFIEESLEHLADIENVARCDERVGIYFGDRRVDRVIGLSKWQGFEIERHEIA